MDAPRSQTVPSRIPSTSGTLTDRPVWHVYPLPVCHTSRPQQSMTRGARMPRVEVEGARQGHAGGLLRESSSWW